MKTYVQSGNGKVILYFSNGKEVSKEDYMDAVNSESKVGENE